MKTIRIFLLIILAAQVLLPCNAQTGRQFGIVVHAGVSHSGWNLSLAGQLRHNDWGVYLGPSFLLNRGSFGICTGADYYIPTNKEWLLSVVNLNYQFYVFDYPVHNDFLHETHLSYGLHFKVGGHFFVQQQLGYGFYAESAYLENIQKRKTFTGYNGLVKVRAGYNF